VLLTDFQPGASVFQRRIVMEFRRGDVTMNKYLLVLEFGFGVVS
jgi:hypothetical protein